MNALMVTKPLLLRITDSGGSSHVEERWTWGEDGPARLHASIEQQYLDEWRKAQEKAKDGPPVPRPIVAIISRAQYDRERFGRKAA